LQLGTQGAKFRIGGWQKHTSAGGDTRKPGPVSIQIQHPSGGRRALSPGVDEGVRGVLARPPPKPLWDSHPKVAKDIGKNTSLPGKKMGRFCHSKLHRAKFNPSSIHLPIREAEGMQGLIGFCYPNPNPNPNKNFMESKLPTNFLVNRTLFRPEKDLKRPKKGRHQRMHEGCSASWG